MISYHSVVVDVAREPILNRLKRLIGGESVLKGKLAMGSNESTDGLGGKLKRTKETRK